MQPVLSVCILASLVTIAMSLICQFPHCEKVDCPEVKDCNGTVKLGGGYCGCCIACFTTLYEGDDCEIQDGLDILFYPNTSPCDYGLYCDTNTTASGVCVRAPFIG